MTYNQSMGNIKSVDTSYFDGFSSELNGKFKRLRHLINNNQADGNYHEEIIRAVLRNFLTKRFSVKTGFIFQDDENVSRQIDILIVDENSPAAYIFQEGEFAVVMPEAVVAVAEIKTTLSSKEHDLAVQNIASAKKLFDQPFAHPGIIFGYQSNQDDMNKMSDTKADRWLKREATQGLSEGSRFHGPDAIIWLNDNYSLLRYNSTTKTIGDGLTYNSFRSPDGNIGWQLSVFLAIIVGACEHAEFNRTRTFGNGLAKRLLGMNLMEVSDISFELGKGKL